MQAGLEAIAKAEPNLLLLDVLLPAGNGVEQCQQIKSLYPALEIVMLTAHGNVCDGVEAMRNGAFD